MTSRLSIQWLMRWSLYIYLTDLSSAQSTVSPSPGPDSSIIAVIVLTSILVGIGALFCIGGVCFCCYKKCSDGCYV